MYLSCVPNQKAATVLFPLEKKTSFTRSRIEENQTRKQSKSPEMIINKSLCLPR